MVVGAVVDVVKDEDEFTSVGFVAVASAGVDVVVVGGGTV